MENNTKKITKREYYETLLDILSEPLENFTFANEAMTQDGLVEFINNELKLLDAKVEAAQKRAAEKKKEGDTLRDRIYDILNSENYMTITEIVNALADPAVSAQKVTPRLTQLKDLNLVEKNSVSIEVAEGKNKKFTAYRRK